MSYVELTGNLFASKAQALVNTVNCVGPMGKGIALEFRRRFPEMYAHYRAICLRGELRPGQILPFRKSSPWVLNFAIKDDWKHPSKIEWIETCLSKFCAHYPKLGVRSVAFPWMGAMNGGLPLEQIQEVTRRFLRPLTDIEIEVYTFDPAAGDPLYEHLCDALLAMEPVAIAHYAGISRTAAATLHEAVTKDSPSSFTRLLEATRFGKSLADKVYALALRVSREEPMASPVPQTNIFAEEHGFDRSRAA